MKKYIIVALFIVAVAATARHTTASVVTTCQWPNVCEAQRQSYQPCVWPNTCLLRHDSVARMNACQAKTCKVAI